MRSFYTGQPGTRGRPPEETSAWRSLSRESSPAGEASRSEAAAADGEAPQEEPLSAISPAAWDAVREGMRQMAADSDVLSRLSVETAGKTGTAQQDPSRPNHALFIGFGPYEAPEIAAATRIAYGYSSSNAVEVTADIFRYYFGLESRESLVTGEAEPAGSNGNIVADLSGFENCFLPDAAKRSVKDGGKMEKFLHRLKEWAVLPDFLRYWDIFLAAAGAVLSGIGVFLIRGLEPELAGRQLGGAARWLAVGSFRFQPSETAKLLLILFFSRWFAGARERGGSPFLLLQTAGLAAAPMLSILEEPDLSTTIVLGWILWCMFSSSGVDKKVLGRLLGAGSLLFGLFLFFVTRPGQTILNEYQYRRIMAWLSPAAWAEESYQQAYSVLAIGSGGMTGRLGDASGTAPAVIESGFLPDPHTDFIMAAAGQELGIAVNVGIQRKQSGSGRERKNIVHW